VASQSGIDIVNPAGTITLDVNRDGLPDILTSQNNIRKADISPRVYLFQNTGKFPGRKSLKVHLSGVKSSTQGLGAMVMLYLLVKDKKIVHRRWVESTQGGLPSQNEDGILFGIDAGMEPVGIKVRWPFMKKSGFGSGEVMEKLYPLSGMMNKNYVEVTVCEDGKILSGKISCTY
jgi:hypothetical protein